MINALANEKRLTINELVESIDMEVHNNGATLFKITESFPKKGRCIYLVREVEVEEEDGIILFHDRDDVIFSNHLVTSSFLKSSIINIIKMRTAQDELECYRLLFKNGEVQIQPIIW